MNHVITLKRSIVFVFLNIVYLGLFAQIPLVYTTENTGTGCAAPPLPSFSQLPVIEPLTDPFMWSDGRGRSTNFADWQCRRNEIRAEIENYEIGPKRNRPETITASFVRGTNPATGTLTVNVTVNGQTLTLTSQVALPSGNGPFPAVIGMNSPTGSLPGDIFSSRNIARITFNHNQVTTYGGQRPTDPYYRLYPDLTVDNMGQYSAWAWGVSRLIDGLELVQGSLPIDLKRIGVTGCSYAGKMALFSGAFDERIALTIAQESGGGGAPAWRVSETLGAVEKLGATDYNWFKEDMRQFSGTNVSKLPHDHHELMAMVAPRALLVTGNTEFEWLANPSTYVSARAAHEVYKTFGIGDRFGFYIDGGHNHCAIPATQRPAIEAFVEKFLLGNQAANTNVTVHPYPQLDYERWYKWWGTGNPTLPAEPIGKRIWLEAECATVGSDWNIVNDPLASDGKYVTVKAGLNSTVNAPAGANAAIVFTFTIDSAAPYNFVGRLNAPTANDDSYWIKIDNGAFVTINGLATSGWLWTRLTSADLTVGQHTVTLAYREDGAHIDKLLVTTSNATITGLGSPAGNCAGIYYRDADGDGWGRSDAVWNTSTQPVGWVPQRGDCVDWNPAIHPDTPELPNGMDDNCDGIVDEGFIVQTYYKDVDGDGWGRNDDTKNATAQPQGYVLKGGDCADWDANINPGASEVYNWKDDDCDGLIDEGSGTATMTTYYKDVDGDGWGRNDDTRMATMAPPGYVARNGDCADWDASIHPGATEVFNWKDDDCDGLIDEGVIITMNSRTTGNNAGKGVDNDVANKVMNEQREGLMMEVLPNPSPADFTLRIQSRHRERIQIEVTDALGRIVERRTGISPNGTLRLGQMYRKGVYLLKLVQGKQTATVRLVKQ